MATQADVRRIALGLADTREEENRFAFAVRCGEAWKPYCWVWLERIHPKKARVPCAEVLAIRTASLDEKEAMLLAEPERCFTERHYDGYPAVLVRLEKVTARELRPLITEAWRCQAPKGLEPRKAKTVRR